MKTCSKCKIEKAESEFFKKTSTKDGLDSSCKLCIREYRQTDAYKEVRKAYKQTDAYKAYKQTDSYKASQKAYWQSDTYKEYMKAHRQTDAYKKRKREYGKAYYLRRKAEALAGNAGQSGDK